MAKGDKSSKGTGGAAANVEPRHEEQRQAEIEAPPVDIGAGVEVTATEAPQDEPGPEDFERHTLAQLKAGKAADMTLRADLERQLAEVKDREARRDAVFAPRFIQEASRAGVRNPILEINGTKLFPRARKGGVGGFATHTARSTFDV